MFTRFTAASLLAVLVLAAPLWAQTPKSADAAGPKQDKATGYPASVKKELYASNDMRGKEAPNFAVEKWLSSEPGREGKTVLIDFWATWCGPCVKLVPELVDFQKKFKDDLVVIGVSDEKEDTVRKFMKDKKVTYSMAIDTTKKMSNELGIKGIPHVLVISSDGIVRWQGYPLSDDDQLTEKTLKQIIDTDKAARAKRAESKPKAADQPPSGTPAKK